MPSIIDFKSYKPTFIGKPVDELATMMKSTAERQQRVYDTTSTMDMMLSETSEKLESSELYRVDEARTKIKESLGELANATDHRTSDVKLNKMVLDLNKDKGLNAAMTKSANFKKAKDDAHAFYMDGKTDRSIYEKITSMFKYEPVEADINGYYDTNIESSYENVKGGGNAAGYNFAEIVDFNELLKDGSSNLQNIYGGTPTVVYVKDPKTGQNIRMIKIKRTGVSGGIAGSDNGEDLISVEEYSNSLKSILDNDPAAVNYMQDIALAKGNTPEEVAKDIATAYAINHSAVQNMDRYINAPLDKIDKEDNEETPVNEIEGTTGIVFKRNITDITDLTTPDAPIEFDKKSEIGKLWHNTKGVFIEAVEEAGKELGQFISGDYSEKPKVDKIESKYNYKNSDDIVNKKIANNTAEYLFDFNLDKFYEFYDSDKTTTFEIPKLSESLGDPKGTKYNRDDAERLIFEGVTTKLNSYKGDIDVAAYGRTIPEVNGKPYVHSVFSGLNEQGVVKKDKDGNTAVSGSFIDRLYMKEGDPTIIHGKDFKEDVIDKLPEGSIIDVDLQFDASSPYASSSGVNDFDIAYRVTFSTGENYIMSGALGGTNIDGLNSHQRSTLKRINSLKYGILKPLYIPLSKTTSVKIVYDKDKGNGAGKYVLGIYKDGKRVGDKTVDYDTEAQVYKAIRESVVEFNKLSNK